MVENETAVPIQGAVISLAATPPNVGTTANVTTDASGAWSATVAAVCAYTARVYWQSASDGPLLAETVNVSTPSSTTVHVAWQTVILTLSFEFPHSANASVSEFIPDGFSFFVEANHSGSIPLGFLPIDASGSPGYPFSMNGSLSETGGTPYETIRPAARAYRVQDLYGNSAVYAVPWLQASFGSASVADPLGMAAAVARVQARGSNPYVQVSPHGGTTIPFSVTNASHLWVGSTTGIFGVTLEDYVTVRTNSTLTLGLAVLLVNTTNATQCYVVDPEAAQIHSWYFGDGSCP